MPAPSSRLLERLPAPSLPAWIERQLPEVPGGFRRFRVRVEGRHLHVMTAGPADALPVLLLHGNPTWGFLWRKVVAELLDPAGYDPALRLVMPDLIGLGFSDKPRNPAVHTLENHARWIGGVIDGVVLAPSRPSSHERLLYVGHDWGGPIGLRALADRPERLAGLVLLNTAAGPPRPGFRPTKFHRFARSPAAPIAFRLLGFPQRALHTAQGDRDSMRGEVARAYRWPLRGWSRNAAPLALARMVPDSLDHPSVPALERCHELVESFDKPSAIVWGERDPVLGRLLARIERVLPRAEVTRTQAGHFLQEEVPREIAAAIRKVAARAF
jgi:cis-3-alkyl-4-acyloxetan-2-one decarboxylase